MPNLYTIFVDEQGNITSQTGWFVTKPNDQTAHVYGIGHVVSPQIVKFGDTYWLQSASIEQHEIVESLPEGCKYRSKLPKIKIEISARTDAYIYYRIFLPKQMNISKDFEVIIDTLVEDPYIAEKYHRMVVARRSDNCPLLVDNQNTLCISPL